MNTSLRTTRTSRLRTVSIAVLAVASLATVAACGGGAKSATQEPTQSGPTTSPSAPAAESTSPLTGLPGNFGTLLAVKIDNTTSALPHVGLTSADNVYVERVEGGLTRLAAVFASRKPAAIVPVRSARETDAELLRTYGKIPVAFSGSVGSVHTLLAAKGLVDVSADKGGLGYYRVSDRAAPYDLAGDPKALTKRGGKAVKPTDIGLTFGTLPAGGKPATSVTARFPAARISFEYKTSTNRWVYYLDGNIDQVPGKAPASASTVVVQYVTIGSAGRNDTASNAVPFTETVGKGNALVLRDGRAFKVKWSRSSDKAPTSWTYKGADFPMAPGQTWFVLQDKTVPATTTK